MIRFFTILLVGILFFSCKEEIPENDLHYDKATLINVMADMYVASEVIKKIDPEQKDSMRDVYRFQIAQIHGVDMHLIEKDLNALSQHPEYYTELHKQLRDSLDWFEKEINAMKYD